MMTRNYSKNAVIKFNINPLNIEKPADVIVSKDEETTIGIVIPPIATADEIAAIDFLNVKYQMRRAKATALRIFYCQSNNPASTAGELRLDSDAKCSV